MYRKYLDLLLSQGKENYQVSEKDKKYLLDLFNRGGSCTGYYQMGNGPQMMAFTNEKKTNRPFTWNLRQRERKDKGSALSYSQAAQVILNIYLPGM